MTKKEFQDLARYMGASLVFNTAPVAVFNGPRMCVTVELDDSQLEQAKPVELANVMATAAMLN